MTEEFKYETVVYYCRDEKGYANMAQNIEKRFNLGWKPTTNGPCLAVPINEGRGPKNWVFMYVFAKEKAHGHN